jgi:ubiquinone/menaquinone biosynthesis C-methylase UbiE
MKGELKSRRRPAPVNYAEIRGDFEFFRAHSTETQIAAFGPHMAWPAERSKPVRVLDFGCGAGAFTERLLRAVGPSPEFLMLVLVESVNEQLEEAARTVAPLASRWLSQAQMLKGRPASVSI